MQRLWWLLPVIVACAEQGPPPSSTEHLIGVWRAVPSDPARVPVEDRELVTFTAGGTYTIAKPRGGQSGRFTLSGNDLTITTDDGWIRTGVAATGDFLITDALFPTGETLDLVGTWTGSQASPAVTTAITLELDADGAARITQTGSLSGADTATWVEEAGFAVLTFTSPTRTRAFPAIPGLAIGEWLYERVE